MLDKLNDLDRYGVQQAFQKAISDAVKESRVDADKRLLDAYKQGGYRNAEARVNGVKIGTHSVTNIDKFSIVVDDQAAFNEWYDELGKADINGTYEFIGTPQKLETIAKRYPKDFKKVPRLTQEQLLTHIKVKDGIPLFEGDVVEGVAVEPKELGTTFRLSLEPLEVVHMALDAGVNPLLLDEPQTDESKDIYGN